MKEDQNSEDLKKETKTGIRRIGDIRKKITQLEQMGIPKQHEEFEELREEVEILLDHLLLEQKIDLETSHLIRNKLRRIDNLFQEMRRDGHFTEDAKSAEAQLDYDKEKQDAKLEIVQLMLSQIFPKLSAKAAEEQS